jgi:HPt (histidine-containing phosphotransfer) domain-containing protein
VVDRAEELRKRLLATFRVEAEEHLRSIRTALDDVANDPASERAAAHLESLFRSMHTLKGAARSVGLDSFEATCHRSETMLSELIKSGAAIDPEVIRTLQETSDTLAGVVTSWPPASGDVHARDAGCYPRTGCAEASGAGGRSGARTVGERRCAGVDTRRHRPARPPWHTHGTPSQPEACGGRKRAACVPRR